MSSSESSRQAYYGDTLQPWDLIKALGMGADFCAGNVIKYVGRYRSKNGLDDLKKAEWYLSRLIELKEQECLKSKSSPTALPQVESDSQLSQPLTPDSSIPKS